ncbi:MAG: hypothetical protein HKN33_17840 [Pyrinomonadaceae bacterium]|nr:hypothetical protein [Pyrinomonadaceae bacterium]
MVAKIVMTLGILGFLLGLFVSGVSLALPILTDGRTSYEEAMLGFVPGALLVVFSLFLALIGMIFMIKGKKK